MKNSDIRDCIIGGLNEYMGGECPFLLSTTAEPKKEYPYGTYTITNPRLEPVRPAMYEEESEDKLKRTYETIIEQVYSFTIIGNEEDQVQDLTHKAINFFRIYGIKQLSHNNIVVVEVSNVQNRDSFVTIEYEKRVGFDVRFRMVEISEYEDVEYIGATNLNVEEEV